MIASDAKFIMNGANHLAKTITSYPFAIFSNDVWIGYNVTIMAELGY